MKYKRVIAGGAALTASLGLSLAMQPANAAPAAPAKASIAATVPPGCITSWNGTASTYDSSGNVVSTNAIHYDGTFAYSSSGASVALDGSAEYGLDGHTYTISVHHWENNAGHINGPGGYIDNNVASVWRPSPYTWYTRNSNPAYVFKVYDKNRPSVGTNITILPCP